MADKRISPEEARRIIEEEQARNILAEQEARKREAFNRSLRGRLVNKASQFAGNVRDRIQSNETVRKVQDKTSIFVTAAVNKTVKSLFFWKLVLYVLVGGFLLQGIIGYWTGVGFFYYFKKFIVWSVANAITLLIAILFIFIIIIGFLNKDKNSRWIAMAFIIWIIDVLPENIPFIGKPYAGFEFNLSGALSVNWLMLIASPFFMFLLFLGTIGYTLRRRYVFSIMSLAVIWSLNRFIVDRYLNPIQITFVNWVALIIFAVIFFLAIKHIKDGNLQLADYFSYLFMILVATYFFTVNNGWMRNLRAWAHVGFIILFGIGYIMRKEENPAAWHLWIPGIALVDFYVYNLATIFSNTLPGAEFFSILTLIVIIYCMQDKERETDYPVLALSFLMLIVFVFSIPAFAIDAGLVEERARKGADIKDVYTTFADKIKEIIEGRLDIATAGLYRGNVEKNRYESLGVYFSNIRAADPRFYTTDPITVWGSIRSKTYKDAVIINFSCYRWKDNNKNKIQADKIIPNIKFLIFTLEEVDTECTFLPKDKPLEVPAGSNTITFSAEYNFGTDAYIKTYFMNRDRFRAYARENVDPLTEFGIKDKNPVSVSTNGPVEIGISTVQQPPITVSEGYAIKPAIGITLTNRKEIQDKDKRIITRWEGKIKNITELILLVPPGIKLQNDDDDDSLPKYCKSKNPEEKIRCPCSMPFYRYDVDKCRNTCEETVWKPCLKACGDTFKKEDEQTKCGDECNTNYGNCQNECKFLFSAKDDNIKGDYKGYALDVGSLEFKDLNKDIDKHRSFVCRFDPSASVLGNEPIATRYFRVRARYNYLLENSVTVNVETPPIAALSTVPDDFYKIASEKIIGDYGFGIFPPDLISAIAWVETRWRHCCEKEGQTSAKTCAGTSEIDCPKERTITSGSSLGIMQIHYQGKSITYANQFVKTECPEFANDPGKGILNKNCNIKIGKAILNDKYKSYGTYGCQSKLCRDCGYSKYTGIYAAIRGYNGFGCNPANADINYVEKVRTAWDKIKQGAIIDNSGIQAVFKSEDAVADESIYYGDDSASIVQSTDEDPYPVSIAANFVKGLGVSVTWNKGGTDGFSYKITRNEQNQPQSAVDICKGIIIGTRDGNCFDNSYQSGKTYVYKIELVSSSTRQPSGKTSDPVTIS